MKTINDRLNDSPKLVYSEKLSGVCFKVLSNIADFNRGKIKNFNILLNLVFPRIFDAFLPSKNLWPCSFSEEEVKKGKVRFRRASFIRGLMTRRCQFAPFEKHYLKKTWLTGRNLEAGLTPVACDGVKGFNIHTD